MILRYLRTFSDFASRVLSMTKLEMFPVQALLLGHQKQDIRDTSEYKHFLR